MWKAVFQFLHNRFISRLTLHCLTITGGQLLAAGLLLLAMALQIFCEILPVKVYTSADGLIYESVRRVYQDSRGFIWFCTPVGVSRFDGYSFKNYAMEDGLKNPNIIDIVEDANGVFWFGSDTGIYRFDPRAKTDQENKFVLYPVTGEPLGDQINRLYKTARGEVFAATANGLFQLNDGEKEKKFARVELNASGSLNQPLEVYALAEDAENSLWIGHARGLTRLLPDKKTVHYEVQPELSGDAVRSLSFDNQKRLWIISEKRSVIVFNPEPSGAVNLSDNAPRRLRFKIEGKFDAGLKQGAAYLFPAAESLADGDFRSVKCSSDGTVWLPTRSKGLAHFDGSAFRLYTRENGLSDNSFNSIVEDSFGNLWIGSYWGVMRIAQKGFTTFNKADGLADEAVFQTFADETGRLYVVNANFVINEFDGNKFITVKPNLPANLPAWFYNRITKDRGGEWWIATTGGLFHFPRTEKIEQLASASPLKIYTTENGLPSNNVMATFEDSRGDIWISLWDAKAERLARLERATGKIHRYSQSDGLPASCLPSFFDEDAAGNVFAACSVESAVAYSGGRFIAFSSEELKNGGNLHDIFIDSKSRVWISTSLSGLVRIDNPFSPNPQLTTYTNRQGLSSNHIQYATEDAFGRIYYVTSRGMDRLTPESGKIEYFTIGDGLPAAGYGSAFRGRDNSLWIGTARGLAKFIPKPDSIAPPPQVYIGKIHAAGENVPVSALGETEVGGITLEPGKGQLQIEFYGLNLTSGEDLRYQYRLDGAGEDWSEPSSARSANYPNVAAGNYRFLVRAVNNDGSAGEKTAIVGFTVLRPIWQRWWFLLGAVFLISLAIYALYRYRVAQIIKLERVRTRIATDLHDDIGSSLSQIAILSEVVRQKVGDNGANEPLNLIADRSREMVDSMSDIVWAINPQKDHLKDLVQRMRRFAGDTFESQDLPYTFKTPENLKDITLGADTRREIYLIFKECVNNLAKHSKCRAADISLSLEADYLVIEIRDDGCGFDVAEKIKAAVESYGGNGLPNMQRRAAALGGRFSIESAPGKGTQIRLQIPVSKKIFAG